MRKGQRPSTDIDELINVGFVSTTDNDDPKMVLAKAYLEMLKFLHSSGCQRPGKTGDDRLSVYYQDRISVDTMLDLHDAIEHLSPSDRKLIFMRYYQGKSVDDIASEAGKNWPNSIYYQLNRIHGKLRRLMHAY
jgi:DNA-directed RNA polymerase specialized sigma24 family protein